MAYSAAADLYQVFGTTNVETWADLDNDDTGVAARITEAITVADAKIDAILRGCHLRIPVVTEGGATPVLITDLSAKLAGIWLYEARGSKDFNPKTQRPYHRYAFMKAEARRTLEEIRGGHLRLDAV
jgi:phage gp36-like protein